jgi:hypothetical protein
MNFAAKAWLHTCTIKQVYIPGLVGEANFYFFKPALVTLCSFGCVTHLYGWCFIEQGK